MYVVSARGRRSSRLGDDNAADPIAARYEAAIAYARRALDSVESGGVQSDVFSWALERYAGSVKTEPQRNDLRRIEARWKTATGDERARVARDAELLADRIQETLPGAPQDRPRTNLTAGEVPTSTPATSYNGEVQKEAEDAWQWTKDTAGSVTDSFKSIGKWLLVAGGLYLGIQVVRYVAARRTGGTDRGRKEGP